MKPNPRKSGKSEDLPRIQEPTPKPAPVDPGKPRPLKPPVKPDEPPPIPDDPD